MKTQKLIITLGVILVVLVVAGFITKEIIRQVTEKITQDITEREVARITKQEVGRITQQGTERSTQEETERITNKIRGQGINSEEYICDIAKTPREFNKEPYYTGPLIDTHVHMPVASKIISDVAIRAGFEDMPASADISIDYINCLFDSEGITKTFGFFIVPNIFQQQTVNHVKNV